jgi:hypothetical protein
MKLASSKNVTFNVSCIKINFITNKNKSNNQVGKTVKCYCQFHSYVLFVLQTVFENESFNRNTTYRNFNFDWVRG